MRLIIYLMAISTVGDSLADVNSTQIPNSTLQEIDNDLKGLDFRRREYRQKKSKKDRSTSSSSGEKKSRSSDVSKVEDSLLLSGSLRSSSSTEDEKTIPFPHLRGWRRWHRICPPCPEDMRKKWRDPSIQWVCGGYQRARRSFKSLCMMHYRNCQDGTMFTKVHDHRCGNDTAWTIHHGVHFFYDYRAKLSDDSETSSSESTDEFSSSTD